LSLKTASRAGQSLMALIIALWPVQICWTGTNLHAFVVHTNA